MIPLRRCGKGTLLVLAALAGLALPAPAALNVFLNFDATWITELNAATALAGVTTLSTTERSTLQNNIRLQLQTIYTGYGLSFTSTDPGGTRESIDYGATTTSTSNYGSAPDDPGNRNNGQTASASARRLVKRAWPPPPRSISACPIRTRRAFSFPPMVRSTPLTNSADAPASLTSKTPTRFR